MEQVNFPSRVFDGSLSLPSEDLPACLLLGGRGPLSFLPAHISRS